MNSLGRNRKNILSRENAQKLFKDHYDDIVACVQHGLNSFANLPPAIRSNLRNRTLAGVLNDLIVKDAVRRFEGDELIQINDDCDGAFFIFSGLAALRFKKVTTFLAPSNVPTRRQLQIREQQLEFEGISRPTVVNVGYQLNSIWTDVTGVTLFCRRGGSIVWKIPVAGDLQSYMFDADGNARPTTAPIVRSTRKRKEAENA